MPVSLMARRNRCSGFMKMIITAGAKSCGRRWSENPIWPGEISRHVETLEQRCISDAVSRRDPVSFRHDVHDRRGRDGRQFRKRISWHLHACERKEVTKPPDAIFTLNGRKLSSWAKRRISGMII